MDDGVHEFLTADTTHKQADEIYAKLNEVVYKLKDEGYVPDTSCVLVDLDEDEKEDSILWHSEKTGVLHRQTGFQKQIVARISASSSQTLGSLNFNNSTAAGKSLGFFIRNLCHNQGICVKLHSWHPVFVVSTNRWAAGSSNWLLSWIVQHTSRSQQQTILNSSTNHLFWLKTN
ncbi:pentatricopeptide repeat-containing At4g14820 [Olea europaea subsp. europaea]|uniref:Pentatricopeptide repeat-containing At4g14820 n=1 Tax=Olea europaea subsp. europaea TaxID=158383 RepID=A0A8S0VHR0_OLEEU|nr:pentatricopeptide repeat-containing At4g14820 [Olea europaea subsp. europaea]